MALLSTAALTYVLIQRRMEALQRWLGAGTHTLMVAVPVSIGTFLAWTMAGLIIATVYDVTDLASQPNVLGSPSAPFLVAVAALAVMPLPLLLLLWSRQWWVWCGMSAAFLGLFGWFMPLLAER